MTFHCIYRFAINGNRTLSSRRETKKEVLSTKGKAVILKLLQRNRVPLTFRCIYRFAINGNRTLSSRRETKKEVLSTKGKAVILKLLQRNRVPLTFRCIYRFAINGCQVYSSRREAKKKVLSVKEKRLLSQESSRKNQCAVLSAFSRLSAYKSSYSTMRLMVSVNSKYCSRLA